MFAHKPIRVTTALRPKASPLLAIVRWAPYLLLLAMLASCASQVLPPVQEGDIIFHASRSNQSRAIQRATGSAYSHMGLIILHDGQPFVFEAVSPVKYTALDRWIARGEGGHYVVKRLRNATVLLNPAATQRLRDVARGFEGRPYDLAFEWSDDRLYCSELVWKTFDRALGIHVGELQHLRDFNLSDAVVQAKIHERYGNHVPVDAPVISPAAMFDSPLLEQVARQ